MTSLLAISLPALAVLVWRLHVAGRRINAAVMEIAPRPMVRFDVYCCCCNAHIAVVPTLADAEYANLVHHDRAHQDTL